MSSLCELRAVVIQKPVTLVHLNLSKASDVLIGWPSYSYCPSILLYQDVDDGYTMHLYIIEIVLRVVIDFSRSIHVISRPTSKQPTG